MKRPLVGAQHATSDRLLIDGWAVISDENDNNPAQVI